MIKQILSNKKILLVLIILMVGIPLTVFLAQQQQETRSRASSESVQFELSPASLTKNPGESFSVDINIKTGIYLLSGIDKSLTIDKKHVDFVSFTPASFDTVVNNSYSPDTGVLRITLVDNQASTSLTGTIKIGTLTLRAKTVGAAKVTFLPGQVVALTQDAQVPVGASINGLYSIVSAPTLTPTPTPKIQRRIITSPIPTIRPPTN